MMCAYIQTFTSPNKDNCSVPRLSWPMQKGLWQRQKRSSCKIRSDAACCQAAILLSPLIIRDKETQTGISNDMKRASSTVSKQQATKKRKKKKESKENRIKYSCKHNGLCLVLPPEEMCYAQGLKHICGG